AGLEGADAADLIAVSTPPPGVTALLSRREHGGLPRYDETSVAALREIIPAFNLARYLPAAIDSALAQEPPGGPVEVIVIDDGSSDETPQVLAAYSDRVTVLRQPNRGFVATVDRGLGLANGEYIALLDADDEWPRDRL